MIIPLMIVRGKLTRWSKSPAICRDILMIKGSESQLFTYPFVALIIHMRKSRGNIWASTRSGYSSNSGAEGREKWWRHPQHRISAPKLGSLSKIHQDFIFIGSFSQTVRFGGEGMSIWEAELGFFVWLVFAFHWGENWILSHCSSENP